MGNAELGEQKVDTGSNGDADDVCEYYSFLFMVIVEILLALESVGSTIVVIIII